HARSNRLYSAEVTDLLSRPPFPEAGIGAQQNRSKGGTVGRQLRRPKGRKEVLRGNRCRGGRGGVRTAHLPGRSKQGSNWNTFDVSAEASDSSSFVPILRTQTPANSPITVVLNWARTLNKK